MVSALILFLGNFLIGLAALIESHAAESEPIPLLQSDSAIPERSVAEMNAKCAALDAADGGLVPP